MKTGNILYQLKTFRFAINGIIRFFSTEIKAWIHLTALITVTVLGVLFKINRTDWIFISIAVALVFITEIINTGIEKLIDHVHPGYNHRIKHVKDMMAAAVLIAAIMAVIIGVIVFYPYIIHIL